MHQLYDQAQAFLVPIWRGIPASYKRKYRRTIWQQFEDQLRSAAYTSSLSKCLSSLCSKLDVTLRTDVLAAVQQIVNSGLDKPLLKLFREEAVTCVLLVRLENEARKVEWEARQRAEDFEEEGEIQDLPTLLGETDEDGNHYL